MSGHSHYATIHRQKEIKDAKKGQVFSKMARAITIAAKMGGGGDPDSNYKLRMIIEKARASNMPKENIERAISKAAGGEAMEEVTYEGFGPGGISILVEAATDNRNRTGQEIKNVFERGGGSLAGPGAVSFNFESKGLCVVNKSGDLQSQILSLIDLGIEDYLEEADSIEVYVQPEKTAEIKDKLEAAGFQVTSAELIKRPLNYQVVSDSNDASRALKFLETLEEDEDVQKVFTNLDVPDDIVQGIKISA